MLKNVAKGEGHIWLKSLLSFGELKMENANSVATETDYSGIVRVYGLLYLKVIPFISKKLKIPKLIIALNKMIIEFHTHN